MVHMNRLNAKQSDVCFGRGRFLGAGLHDVREATETARFHRPIGNIIHRPVDNNRVSSASRRSAIRKVGPIVAATCVKACLSKQFEVVGDSMFCVLCEHKLPVPKDLAQPQQKRRKPNETETCRNCNAPYAPWLWSGCKSMFCVPCTGVKKLKKPGLRNRADCVDTPEGWRR
jgi:hypothetical protein